jgi:Ca2+-transporting ATPase
MTKYLPDAQMNSSNGPQSPPQRPRAPTITVNADAVDVADNPDAINPSSPLDDSNTLLAVPTTKSRADSWSLRSSPTIEAGSSDEQPARDAAALRSAQKGDPELLKPNPGEEHAFVVENNPFAFSPGQLGKLINPKNLAAFAALGGLAGIEKGIRSDSRAGLGLDEAKLAGSVSFQDATGTKPSDDHSKDPVVPLRSNTQHSRPPPLHHGDKESFADRRRVYGVNRLPERKSKSFLQLAWIALQDHVLILLTIAAIVSLGLGLYQTFGVTHHEGAKVEWVEGVAIVVAITIVVVVGAANDWQKERQFRKLNQKKEDRLVKVTRSGKPMSLSIYDVLVGDVMLLEPGDVVPVDGVFVSGHNLSCDESSATGESDMVKKVPADAVLHTLLHDDAPKLKKLDPFIISGARVLDGVGTFLVTAVGQQSSHGKTMMSLRDDPGLTPLQSKLNLLAGKATAKKQSILYRY